MMLRCASRSVDSETATGTTQAMAIHTICMFGGSGFVGRHLASALVEAGHDLIIPTRYAPDHRDLLVLPTVRLVEGNVYNPDFIDRMVAGCDVVINLVGILNEHGGKGRGFRRAHVELTERILDACKTAGIRRYLHMSALGADAEHGPSLYLRTKGEAEQMIEKKAGDAIDWTIFQPSVVFGRDDSFFNRFAMLLRISPLVFPLACPDARFSPVFVGDVAQAFSRSIDREESFGRRYQLCGPDTHTLRELVVTTAKTIGVTRWVVGLPGFASRMQARVLGLVPGKPFSMDNYLSLQKDSVCDRDGLHELGIQATPMEVEVPRYLARRYPRARYDEFRRLGGRPELD
jgi:NADH dehydrogenase